MVLWLGFRQLLEHRQVVNRHRVSPWCSNGEQNSHAPFLVIFQTSQHVFLSFFFKSKLIYLLDCTRSSLQHVGSLILWHVESNSLIRDRTWAPCSGNTEF